MMPLRGIAAAVETNPIISALPRAPKGRRNTGRGGAKRNPCAQSQPHIQSPEGATENVWHWFDGATHTGQLLVRQCDTPRPTATPLREGMARQRSIDNHCDVSAHPLSERGGRRPGCVAPSGLVFRNQGELKEVKGSYRASRWKLKDNTIRDGSFVP